MDRLLFNLKQKYLSFYKLWRNVFSALLLTHFDFFIVFKTAQTCSKCRIVNLWSSSTSFFCLFVCVFFFNFCKYYFATACIGRDKAFVTTKWYEFIFSNHKNDIPIKKIPFQVSKEREKKKPLHSWVHNQIKKQKWKIPSTQRLRIMMKNAVCVTWHQHVTFKITSITHTHTHTRTQNASKFVVERCVLRRYAIAQTLHMKFIINLVPLTIITIFASIFFLNPLA